eukprot:2908257-Rhodomonas_salina.2
MTVASRRRTVRSDSWTQRLGSKCPTATAGSVLPTGLGACYEMPGTDGGVCRSDFAPMYFLGFTVICNFTMINLFVGWWPFF